VIWFLCAVGYLALHALLYVVVLRTRDTFRRERGIFAYHAISTVLVSLVVLVALLVTPSFEGLATLVAVICLHGIYSTSFLEVWSLSQGSYSLKILRHIASLGDSAAVDTAALEDAGVAHRTHRLEALTTMRIARLEGDVLALTVLGRLAASVLASIAWLANVRQTAPAQPTTAPTP
jgi:hypothetical protein